MVSYSKNATIKGRWDLYQGMNVMILKKSLIWNGAQNNIFWMQNAETQNVFKKERGKSVMFSCINDSNDSWMILGI